MKPLFYIEVLYNKYTKNGKDIREKSGNRNSTGSQYNLHKKMRDTGVNNSDMRKLKIKKQCSYIEKILPEELKQEYNFYFNTDIDHTLQ